SSVIRKGDWKLIETFDPKSLQLYNLSEDLSETMNLAEEKSSTLKNLHAELEAWRQKVGADRMEPNPDYKN
ncbi:MAG: sulfatase, partial [Opitutae bacterium]